MSAIESYSALILPRNALYAIIGALEEDLRELIVGVGLGRSAIDVLGEGLVGTTSVRASRDLGDAPDDVATLIAYADFGDIWQLVATHKSNLPSHWATLVGSDRAHIDRMIAIRNRVMHIRPLEFDDFPLVATLAERIVSLASSEVPRLRGILDSLRNDPASLLSVVIPEPEASESHNLPLSDFDETGFVGRQDVIDTIKGLCLGPYPVITVVGDGGMGKTSAALKVAYDLLDDPASPFEATVWSTSKTTQLTAGDVRSISGAISTSLGLFESVASNFVDGPVASPIDEILDYLGEFRVLLVLDNLETVLDDRIRELLGRLPNGSKVLITSRIGLGAFEHPVKLRKLSESEAIDFIRQLARVRGVEGLTRMENKRLAKYCTRMDHNPLWMKWFVSGVQTGARPEDLLADPGQFLDYSMSNVYGYLDADSRLLLKAMQVVPGEKSQADLVFLTEMAIGRVQNAVGQLTATNMVTATSTALGSSYETRYTLAELPRKYLAKRHPVTADSRATLTKRFNQLRSAGQELRDAQKTNPYRDETLDMRSQGNLVVAKHLLDALSCAKSGDAEAAEGHIDAAKRLTPEWYEVHRVEAVVAARLQNVTSAEAAFEAAIDLEPASASLRLSYGLFALDGLDDPPKAVEQLRAAVGIDSESVDLQLALVRALQRDLAFSESRSVLDSTEAKARRSGLAKWRFWADLDLQHWQRLGDRAAHDGNFETAAEALEKLRDAFTDIPLGVVDLHIRRRPQKAAITAKLVRRSAADARSRWIAENFVRWIKSGALDREPPLASSVGQRASGVITSAVERGFTFASTASGESIFVHVSELELDAADLVVGCEITFEVADGDGGRFRALRVRRADPQA